MDSAFGTFYHSIIIHTLKTFFCHIAHIKEDLKFIFKLSYKHVKYSWGSCPNSRLEVLVKYYYFTHISLLFHKHIIFCQRIFDMNFFLIFEFALTNCICIKIIHINVNFYVNLHTWFCMLVICCIPCRFSL